MLLGFSPSLAQPCISSTGNSAVVTLSKSAGDAAGMQVGDLFRAWNDTLCVGEALYMFSEGQTGIALTVWGDDTLTPEIDGMQTGVMIRYGLFRPAVDSSFVADTVSYLIGDGIYAPGAIMQIATISFVDETAVTVESVRSNDRFTVSDPYPNPSSGVIQVDIGMKAAGQVVMDVYDVLGRHLKRVFEGNLPVGEERIAIDTTELRDGMYLLRVQSQAITETRKIAVLK